MALQKYLECAKATSTHGVRGTLRLESYCDTPEKLAKLRVLYVKKGEEFVPKKVRAASVQKSMVLMTFEDISSLEEAISYKGTVFYADRGDLKRGKGDFFIADMLGLRVLDADSGEEYGTLSEVISPAGRDIYVIEDICGGSFMIPAVKEFVKSVVVEGEEKGIYVKLIEGMRE